MKRLILILVLLFAVSQTSGCYLIGLFRHDNNNSNNYDNYDNYDDNDDYDNNDTYDDNYDNNDTYDDYDSGYDSDIAYTYEIFPYEMTADELRVSVNAAMADFSPNVYAYADPFYVDTYNDEYYFYSYVTEYLYFEIYYDPDRGYVFTAYFDYYDMDQNSDMFYDNWDQMIILCNGIINTLDYPQNTQGILNNLYIDSLTYGNYEYHTEWYDYYSYIGSDAAYFEISMIPTDFY